MIKFHLCADRIVHYPESVWSYQVISVYEAEFEIIVQQALGRLNRDIGSPSCGSFDRAYWGWKQRDFSDATLQAAISLLLEWIRREGKSENVTQWLECYVNFVEHIQYSDGSFDQCYPYERTPGVFYDILPGLVALYDSGLLPSESKTKLEHVISKGIEFIFSTEEVHAEIANHLAAFASALLLHYECFSIKTSREKAITYLERIYHNYDEEEGWFNEYFGPDPGYQTRTLAFLTRSAEILEDEQLWIICGKAARFIEVMMMPDDSTPYAGGAFYWSALPFWFC